MRDLLGDLVVGALVERESFDFDVIGDGPHCLDALGCTHGHVLLVDRHDVATERDRPIGRVTEMCFATTSGRLSAPSRRRPERSCP
jgi:hypothetical protein